MGNGSRRRARQLEWLRKAIDGDAVALVRLRRKILKLKRKQVEAALKAIEEGKPLPEIVHVPYERTILQQAEAMLDRVLGKPRQEVDVHADLSVSTELTNRLEQWRKWESQADEGDGEEDGGDDDG